jgi:hypothetical protein
MIKHALNCLGIKGDGSLDQVAEKIIQTAAVQIY